MAQLIQMTKTCICDLCGAEIPEDEYKEYMFPVFTNCEWEEGTVVGWHIDKDVFGFCSECLRKVIRIQCGYRGTHVQLINHEE